MTDSKHAILAALPGAALYTAWVVWPRLTRRIRRAAIFALVAVTLGAGLRVGAVIRGLVVEGLWKPYVAVATFNPKVQLIMRTAERLGRNDLNTWIGFGPGAYATRAATVRASDVLYKEAERLPSLVPPHTGDAYRAVAYDLYTSEVAASAAFRSGALTNPFSSLVGILGEFGIAGTAIVAILFASVARAGLRRWSDVGAGPAERAAGAAVCFGIPFLLVLGVFDSYLEQPSVTAPFITLALVVLSARPGPGGA